MATVQIPYMASARSVGYWTTTALIAFAFLAGGAAYLYRVEETVRAARAPRDRRRVGPSGLRAARSPPRRASRRRRGPVLTRSPRCRRDPVVHPYLIRGSFVHPGHQLLGVRSKLPFPRRPGGPVTDCSSLTGSGISG
jgi:hypothetical protein